ncbi:capsule biosynthesis GfcC family protein [Rheinheimera sp. UJ51]|uniref:capsule biosynthesis GfcC family protein n=1 Tax=Rheinheimera sp. UJ51 TaxID=2892446 RepID=UPI001E4F969C|nr:capsule biosynthesis GfcC family protein [Rheinheimera sp. UJ51]MCC5450243.1 capsule biosynthesis GfcC family protein [Rheinheimera sp. UJ51]
MSMRQFFLLSILWVSSGAVSANTPLVNVTINHQAYSFETAPRLAEVLKPLAEQDDWYWPATRLYRANSPFIEQQRQQTLDFIAQLIDTTDMPLRALLAQLHVDIKSWNLAERVPLTIDYDLARTVPAFNPRFEKGSYQLFIAKRPTDVHFWGAIPITVSLPHRSAAPASSYITELQQNQFKDTDRVFIMQPDGEVIEVGVQLWNKQHIEIMPGSMVFIPFATHWFTSELTELNRQLLALAVHRIY